RAALAGTREARGFSPRRWSSLRSTAAKRGQPRAIVVAPTFLNLRRAAASRSTCKPAGREMRRKALAAQPQHGGDDERGRFQRQHPQVSQDAGCERQARDREGGATGLGGGQAQGQRKAPGDGGGNARRDRSLA